MSSGLSECATGRAVLGPREAAIDRGLRRLAGGLAIAGGAVLCGLVALVVVSVLGRELSDLAWLQGTGLGRWLGPVNGDFELVELGVAVAVFSFLPHCHITRRNVAVEVFTWSASPGRLAWLRLAGDGIYAVLAALLAWQVLLGAVDLHRFGETTMVLAIPVWWAYPPAVAGLGLLVAVTLWTAWLGVRGLAAGCPGD